MKSSHIIGLSIGSLTIATGLYLGSTNMVDPVSNSHTSTVEKNHIVVTETNKNIGKILTPRVEIKDMSVENIPTDKDLLIKYLDTHPVLRLRIQGMSWYQNFILGRSSIADIEKYIQDAMLIEEVLRTNPSILTQIQYSEVWRNYLNGNISPHNMVYGEIPAKLGIDEFQKNNPELFAKIQNSPTFQRTVSGEETTYSDQKNIIQIILAQEMILQENPHVRAKLKQYGYSSGSIYTSDWREGKENGFYLIKDTIMNLENPKQFDPIVWKEFQESDIGARYRAGTIDPREAFKYINTLSVNLQN